MFQFHGIRYEENGPAVAILPIHEEDYDGIKNIFAGYGIKVKNFRDEVEDKNLLYYHYAKYRYVIRFSGVSETFQALTILLSNLKVSDGSFSQLAQNGPVLFKSIKEGIASLSTLRKKLQELEAQQQELKQSEEGLKVYAAAKQFQASLSKSVTESPKSNVEEPILSSVQSEIDDSEQDHIVTFLISNLVIEEETRKKIVEIEATASQFEEFTKKFKSAIDEKLKKFAREGDLEFIKLYGDTQGLDKLLEVENGHSAFSLAAQNGHIKVLNYVVEEALKQGKQEKLKQCLTVKDNEGKNVLHRVTSIVNCNEIIKVLLKTAADVGLNEYINETDTYYRSTALHMAARRANLSALQELVKAGADISVKSSPAETQGFTPIELLKFAYSANEKEQQNVVNCMRYIIYNTKVGEKYFSTRHGNFRAIKDEKVINTLIEIDFLSGLETAQAHLEGLQKCIALVGSNHSSQIADAAVTSISLISCAKAVQAIKVGITDETCQILAKAKKDFQSAFKGNVKIDETQLNGFLTAEILVNIHNASAQLQAFNYYTGLMLHNPHLMLEGFKKLDKKVLFSSPNQEYLLMKRIVMTIAKSEQINLEQGFFAKKRLVVVTAFLNSLNQTENVQGINKLIQDLHDDILKTKLEKELKSQGFTMVNFKSPSPP